MQAEARQRKATRHRPHELKGDNTMKNTDMMKLELTRHEVIRIRTALLATAHDFERAARQDTDPEAKERHQRSAEMWYSLREKIIEQFEEQDDDPCGSCCHASPDDCPNCEHCNR